MIRRPPRSTQSRSSAASDVYKRQPMITCLAARALKMDRLREVPLRPIRLEEIAPLRVAQPRLVRLSLSERPAVVVVVDLRERVGQPGERTVKDQLLEVARRAVPG